MLRIIAPIVPITEVKRVDIPLVGRQAGGSDLVSQLVSLADLGPAAFAGVVESMLVHLLGRGVMNDVDGLNSLVVGLDPGVDPKRLDADDFFLLVGHRAG